MTKRTAPKPGAPIAAEPWFVELISHAHVAARLRMHDRPNAKAATKIERDAWAKLARYCVATSLTG
jgi:hypothetical protein